MRSFVMWSLGVLVGCAFAQPCLAVPISANFVSALIELAGPQPLPVLLAGAPNNVRLRFHVPDAGSIIALHAITVSVDIYDDADSNPNEAGEIRFVDAMRPLGDQNILLQSFAGGLNGFTDAAPFTVTGAVASSDLHAALAELQDDGFFLIRMNRNGGDFFVQSATVTIDAQVVSQAVPEPASILLFGIGTFFLLTLSWRHRQHLVLGKSGKSGVGVE
jgi:PEP-CTERM motif-containing protein